MSKKLRITDYLDTHKYPEIFFRYPIIVKLLHYINFITILRNWYVWSALRKIRKKGNNDFNFLDAGCGMGDFTLMFARHNPNAKVIGIDYNNESITLANRTANWMKLKNIEFKLGDLTSIDLSEQFDLVLCNSTLQFVKNDELALSNLFNIVKKSGEMILYVPINYHRYLPFMNKLEDRHLNDFYYKYHEDFLMHKYSDVEVKDKLQKAGFILKEIKYTYGFFGAIAFEMFSLLLVGIKKLPIILSIFSIIVYSITLFPLQLIFMLIDFLGFRKNGNGMLLIAGK